MTIKTQIPNNNYRENWDNIFKSETARQANIKAGQDALRRCKTALIKAGIKLPRQKDVPL